MSRLVDISETSVPQDVGFLAPTVEERKGIQQKKCERHTEGKKHTRIQDVFGDWSISSIL